MAQQHNFFRGSHDPNLGGDMPWSPGTPPAPTIPSPAQAFLSKVWALALPIQPLVQLTTGLIHPDFPSTMLAFWLLNDAQLDSLASFYHQAEMSMWTLQYPCPVTWRHNLPTGEKRRKFGKFIGLRGCEGEDPREDDVVVEQAREARYREEDDDAVLRKIYGFM